MGEVALLMAGLFLAAILAGMLGSLVGLGGGVLVVIGVCIAALALPAFVRYRVGKVVDNGNHG